MQNGTAVLGSLLNVFQMSSYNKCYVKIQPCAQLRSIATPQFDYGISSATAVWTPMRAQMSPPSSSFLLITSLCFPSLLLIIDISAILLSQRVPKRWSVELNSLNKNKTEGLPPSSTSVRDGGYGHFCHWSSLSCVVA